jgi:hypothetical protein
MILWDTSRHVYYKVFESGFRMLKELDVTLFTLQADRILTDSGVLVWKLELVALKLVS